ncbi:hypothetical protein CXF37_00010 [Corynebacterium bovis]|nr:hypothetical protein CXF36_00010 [Corynebacterium bovis]RRO85241.1 hypothetical protein CXF37_00010 [Corynebacterium bovis]
MVIARVAMVWLLAVTLRPWPVAEWARAVTRESRLVWLRCCFGVPRVVLRQSMAAVIHRPRPVQVLRRAVVGTGSAQQVGEGWLALSWRMVGARWLMSWWSWAISRSSNTVRVSTASSKVSGRSVMAVRQAVSSPRTDQAVRARQVVLTRRLMPAASMRVWVSGRSGPWRSSSPSRLPVVVGA